jgi:hypothetical protein
MRRWLLLFAVVLAVACTAKRNAKFSEPCAANYDCESGLCFEGRCSKSCVVHADCGKDSLCIEKLCHWPTKGCDDGDLCTEADGIVGGKCHAGRRIDCGDDDQCRTWDCDAKKGCFSTTRNVDAPCEATGLTGPGLCGGGGTDTNGCKCALWQGKVWGPGDEGKLVVGKGVAEKVKTLDRANVAYGGVAAGVGVVVVGAVQPDPAKPAQGWMVKVAGTSQVPWNRAYEAAPNSDQALVDVAAVAGGFVAVGDRAQTAAWLLRIDDAGNPLANVVAPALGHAAVAVAAAGAGGRLVLAQKQGTGGQALDPIAVRVDDTSLATGTLHKLTAPIGITGTLRAVDLATEGTRTIAVGFVQALNGTRQAWVARLGPDGAQQSATLLLPNGVTETELRGVAIAPDGTTAAFGWGRWVGESGQRAWFVRLGEQLAIVGGKGEFVSLGEKSGAVLVAAVPWHGGWLVAGERDGTPGAAHLAGGTVASFPIGTAATALQTLVLAGDSLVLVGNAKTASESDAWLMRTNAQGKDKCN